MPHRLARTAIIVSTYNSPLSLRMCLLGLQAQDERDFEVVIADDGSDDATAAVVREPTFRDLHVNHVWQSDAGYRVRMARNRAIAKTDADFLIFLDGDCVPRPDFVRNHRQFCPRGSFLSGARIDVPDDVHRRFQPSDILSGRVFDSTILTAHDPKLSRYRWRLNRRAWFQNMANLLTWRYCVLVSSNASVWREDVLRVNGFDEAYPGYGSDDRDLGVRLRNSGVRPRYRKFSLIVLHLDHAKPYFDREKLKRNRAVFKRRFRDGTTRIEMGIDTVLTRV